MRENLIHLLYLASAILFVLGLKGLTRVRTARRGNAMSSAAMLVAVVTTLIDMGIVNYQWILIGLAIGGLAGAIAAMRVQMTAMPEMVALFNGSGGGASALVAASVLWLEVIEPAAAGGAASVLGGSVATTLFLSLVIGCVTFSGSLVAFLKLSGRMRGKPIVPPARHLLTGVLILGILAGGAGMAFLFTAPGQVQTAALVVIGLSLLIGVLMVIPIGGADMPVVISLLNSLSGLAAAATGFVLSNNVLIISGALVGASGLILTQIMCVAMNRTLGHVLFAGFGDDSAGEDSEYQNVRSFSAEEAALLLETAERVVLIPGYGLAVAQAQHAARELADQIEKIGGKVTYAIHPVAGRMPGHMNVLLADADVPYEKLIEMDAANPEFKTTDVAIVLGANDVVNPAAVSDPGSPIAGMPILQVYDAQTVIVVKRSLSPGFAGIKNELFERDNTMMLFADAKKALQDILAELKTLTKAA